MRRATLLFNAAAGGGRVRVHTVEAVAGALRNVGLEAQLVATEGPGTAIDQARHAAQSAEIVFACGGDGTVHEVLQGLALQTSSVLGILPMGSANVLARHLGLPRHPVAAALAQIGGATVSVALGKIMYTTSTGEQRRFFASVAGAGADGMLAYWTLAASKQWLGRGAYYLQAARLLASESFSPFQIDYTAINGQQVTLVAVSAMTSRVASLGGILRPMVRRGSLHGDELSLTAIKAPGLGTLPAWAAMSWTGLTRWNRWQEESTVRTFRCGAGHHGPVRVQADGEWLGRTPMAVSLVPDAIRLLVPKTFTLPPAR